jgi:hypothetical protein
MMKRDVAIKDCWIVGQLAGIRMLERELADAFRRPRASAGEDLRQRVAELNAWVNMVDEVLAARASSPRTSGAGGLITMPVHNSGGQLPAA